MCFFVWMSIICRPLGWHPVQQSICGLNIRPQAKLGSQINLLNCKSSKRATNNHNTHTETHYCHIIQCNVLMCHHILFKKKMLIRLNGFRPYSMTKRFPYLELYNKVSSGPIADVIALNFASILIHLALEPI